MNRDCYVLDDSESGYYYFSARYLDPRTSRFVSVDPLLDTIYPYSYTGWNPVMYVDPSGKIQGPIWYRDLECFGGLLCFYNEAGYYFRYSSNAPTSSG